MWRLSWASGFLWQLWKQLRLKRNKLSAWSPNTWKHWNRAAKPISATAVPGGPEQLAAATCNAIPVVLVATYVANDEQSV
jgi:hypothetical protein